MKVKRLISVLLALAMLAGMMAVAIPAAAGEELPFTDVSKADWAYDSVKYVTDNGLMNGTGGGAFTPKANLTRAMVITVLYRMEQDLKKACHIPSMRIPILRSLQREITA
ncbi:MAG: S-layer homology domain-containing protein [Clostridia bacterium]|nr:S-layer homology domain-containing protein [Clostridia bacterium]